ncbi:AAA family ATPase [Quadrisphaera sp. DSM 44207]|uniref:AAA family ATPase n=1 Tax=Quadrisphaera sp. DSM 44207 TaxID=1881057 RepID=UPI00088B4A6A|nr:AAA family ATPase [Quadrisphaera sp. DSM 44207]SDQ04349.1 exonuclease SbcC [Quadrisphaera sp. DSM 44207]
MITVESIEVVNVRSIGHAVVEPLTDGGVTALNGGNGVGKTSILVAALWALYGVTPDGVPVQAMRRQGSTGEVRAVVRFRHDGQLVEVERGLKGAKDTTYAAIRVEGREQAFGRVKAAEAWVVDRLGGLDAEGFLAAFVTRQKELDSLVRARPAERRRLFERLAGIDRMSAAVRSAREEETAVKRRLDVLPGSAEDVAAARRAVDAAQQAAAGEWERLDAARARAGADEATLAAARGEADALARRLEAARAAADTARAADHQRVLAAERAATSARSAEQLAEAAHGGSPQEVQAARAAAAAAQQAASLDRDAREGARRAGADAERDAARAARTAERASRARSAAEAAVAAAEQARARAAAFPSDLEEQAVTAQREADERTDALGALRGEHQRLSAALRTLEAATSPACPTCSTPLPDPGALLETLRRTRDRVAEEGRRAKAAQEAAAGAAAALRRRAQEGLQAHQEARHAADRAERARAEDAEAAAEARAATEEARASRARAEAAQRAAQEASGRAAHVEQEVQRTAAELRRAENAAEAAARLAPAREQAARAASTAAEAERAAAAATAAQAAAAVPDEERRRVETATATAVAQAQESSRAVLAAEGAFRLAEQQLAHVEQALATEQAKLQARVQTLAELERTASVREALDAFRKDRVARLAPEVSEVATDFVARMTGGRFVAVELDEDFTAVVTDEHGHQRPVAWLSGGEESAVALALRVALGELYAGQRGGLLWLDEPFTAQDRGRRTAMMAAIRDLPARQVVVISHASDAADTVDLVLDVVPDPEQGSSVVPASAYGAVAEADLDAVVLDDDPEHDPERHPGRDRREPDLAVPA